MSSSIRSVGVLLVSSLLTMILCTYVRGNKVTSVDEFVTNYCIDCHQGDDAAGGFDWQTVNIKSLLEPKSPQISDEDLAAWEKSVKRLRARLMPPADAERPEEDEYIAILSILEGSLDDLANAQPRPARTPTIRRLTRTEYRNAIRDLLALDLDVESLLPADQESHGFDNITVGDLSPTLLTRYITAAQKISRLAVGARDRGIAGVNFRLPPDRTQRTHVTGLPLGTRGGGLFHHTFAQSGEYEFQIRLMRDRDEHIEGLHGSHDIDLLLDRQLIKRFTVAEPQESRRGYDRDETMIDANLIARTYVSAGPHSVGATFPKKSSSLLEIKRQPFDASYNRHRHPRPEPAIFEVAVTGPLDSQSEPTQQAEIETPSRKILFIDRPDDPQDYEAAGRSAKKILSSIMRKAYRRPISKDDLTRPMQFFQRDWEQHGFDAGIESALAAVLVNPHFLLRVETQPDNLASDEGYLISAHALASRLSFFLWSSLPDDQLLDLADQGRLHESQVLRQQVQRMLRDERSDSLATNFADQWLYLRNLESFTPDLRLFPDFDDNLRESLRQETQLLFKWVLHDDRSVLDLISADFSFLNNRLAKHYGLTGVMGSQYRRVPLEESTHRGGLLRQGSILAISSYATRTSPTIRGNWILENLFGTPAPPPPPDVPALQEKTTLTNLSIRERLAQHRENPACASCHNLMDPVGFAMENYDAVGRWRNFEGEAEIDSTGELPDGTKLNGVEDLEAALLRRPEMFVGTMAEKLLTYALGRGITPNDGPAIRKIVRQAAEKDYRLSALLLGVVESVPFQMNTAE